MDDRTGFQESLSAGGQDEVEPFLPYLLQDLWALGGCPETAIALLDAAGIAPAADERVLDLGCGKGALLIALAQRYGCRGYGVDLMAEFIDEARMLAREHGVEALVEFEARDMRAVVNVNEPPAPMEFAGAGGQARRTAPPAEGDEHSNDGFAWIVYGHDAPIFGDLEATLRALRRAMTPGAHLILDAVCRAPAATGEAAEELPTAAELRASFSRSGFAEIARKTVSVEEVRESNDSNTAAIAKRAEELKRKHPELARAFDNYVANQREESKFLENQCESSYFLLRVM